MGLLDDAIREHLDLKRRHGAAEDEVRRLEQEALGPPRRGEVPEPLAPPAVAGVESGSETETAIASEPVGEALPEPPAAEPPPAEPPAAYAAPQPPPDPDPAPRDPSVYEDEPWLSDAGPGAVSPGRTPAPEDEDVLEETPDFLQETPEHDRLWFEQKPPKDFDFDK